MVKVPNAEDANATNLYLICLDRLELQGIIPTLAVACVN